MQDLHHKLQSCRLCAARFAATKTAHNPRPVVWFGPKARILIAGQAPGARVHNSGVPFSDRSGVRLREWLGLDEAAFYDREKIAIVPMAFCFPGYDARGADLPPPPVCATTWHAQVMGALPALKLRILVGGAAQRWHLGARHPVTKTVANWRAHAPGLFPLPHPSWRNNGWLRDHPWFQTELLPDLKTRIQEVLDG